jgi:hypothetical protein
MRRLSPGLFPALRRFCEHGDVMPPLFAYIGPGAGFAFLGSFLSLIASFFLAAGSLLLWPFRAARAVLRRRRGFRRAKIRRLIFLGLDGLDPRLAERFMAAGKLPNLSRLKEQGSFQGTRVLSPPAHHVPCAVAGGVVHFCHRGKPGQAQHF